MNRFNFIITPVKMIYKFNQIVNHDIFSFKENRFCFRQGTRPSTPEASRTSESPRQQFENHLNSLNEGARNFQFRANLSRRYLRNQNITTSEQFRNAVSDFRNIGTNFNINNDEQLVRIVAHLQQRLGLPIQDNAQGVDGILGNNTWGQLERRIQEINENRETERAPSREELATIERESSDQVSRAASQTPVTNEAIRTAREAVDARRQDIFRSSERGLINESHLTQAEYYSNNPDLHQVETPEWFNTAARNPNTIRRIFIQQEFSNFDNISTYLRNLSISFEQFAEIVKPKRNNEVNANTILQNSNFGRIVSSHAEQNFENATTQVNNLTSQREELITAINENPDEDNTSQLQAQLEQVNSDLEQARNEQDFAQEALRSTENNFQGLLNRINELQNLENSTIQDQAELAELLSVFRNVQLLLEEIPRIEHSEARNLSSDYVVESIVEDNALSEFRAVYAETNPSRPDFEFNINNSNNRLTLLALLVQVYGPLNSLKNQGIISQGNPERQRGRDIHAGNAIFIDSFGPKADLVATLIHRYREIFRNNRRTQNLTEAIYDFQNKDHYPRVLEAIRVYRENELIRLNQSMESTDTELTRFYLDQLFSNRLTGPVQSSRRIGRGRNRQATEMHEIEGANIQAELEDDIISRSYSDPAMVNYLTSRIQTYENGRSSFNINALEAELVNLLRFGQAAILMAVDLSPEERTRLNNLDISEFSLRPPRELNSDEITLIRRGLVLLNNTESAEARATLESISTNPEHQAIYEAILNNPNIDRAQAVELTNKVIELLVGLDLSNLPDFSLEDIRLGLHKEILIWQTEDGRLEVGIAGGTTTPDFSNLAAGITPVVGLQVRYSPTEGVGAQGGLTVGLGTVMASGGMNFNFGNEMQVRVNAGGGLLLGIPTLMANASLGQGYQARVNRSIERAAESFLGSLDSRTIREIANGNLSREQILEIANQEPIIAELFENLPEPYNSENIDPTLANNLKVYFVETLCQNLINYGVENARGIGWEVGLTLVHPIGAPAPILIPILRIEFRTGTRMYYSERIAASQVDREIQTNLRRQLHEQFSQIRSTETYQINSETGIISYDGETGAREVIKSPIPSSAIDVAEITRESTLNRLNSIESQIGIRFEEATPEEIENSNIDFVFSLNDLNDLNGLTPNRLFHIYNDPSSGFTMTDLGHNRIGIRFGAAGALPPANLAITRSEQISAIGSRPTPVSICFTNRAISPQEIIQNPFASQIIAIDSRTTRRINSPYTNLHHGRGEYQRIASELLTEPRTDLNFSPEEIAAGTALLEAVRSSASTERLSPSPELQAAVERLLQNEDFRQALMQVTTNRPDYSFNTVEFRELLAEYLNESEISLTDSVIMYLESVLIPGTYQDLSQIRPSRRLQEVNRVTREVMGRFVDSFLNPNALNTHKRYDENGRLIEYTNSEKETIRNWLINMNILTNESGIAEQLENLDNLTRALDDLGQGTVLLTTAGIRRVTESQGFREMILNPNSNIQVLGAPRRLDLSGQYPNEVLVAGFIQNIVEPPFREGEIQNFAPEELQHLFNSQTLVKFLEMNFQFNGQQIPVLTALYGTEGSTIVRELYSRINSAESMKEYLDSLDPLQLDLLNHFTNFMREIRSKGQNGDTVNLIQYGTDRNLGEVTIDIEAGTVFIASCGNLTVFYNSGFSATINHELSSDIIAATDTRMNEMRATAQAQTLGVGVAVRLPGRSEVDRDPKDPERPPETPPPEIPPEIPGKDPTAPPPPPPEI